MDASQIIRTVNELSAAQRETECVEFKHNNTKPDDIGEYISALSNSATLLNEPAGFIVWGVSDTTHEVVGTNFKPHTGKNGEQELENWLSTHLTPRVAFEIYEVEINNLPVVIFEIPAARHTPVRFKDNEFIRVGSYKKKPKDYPEKERALWELLGRHRFEHDIALADTSGDAVLELLDYPSYFHLTKQPLPPNSAAILNRLHDENIIIKRSHGGYDITNFGAVLFARNLTNFSRLSRKALRVILYKGKNRVVTQREQPGVKGYAVGFDLAVSYINNLLPVNEQIGQAFRQEVRMYPKIAIREIVANALIHQDFSVTGAGPTVEIFDDRLEITNPGQPLIETLRFIDQPPRSRNEALAAFMRRINICEERGSGIDKVITAIETFQLPPPDFRISGDNVVSVLFAGRLYADMTPDERIRACYQHACLRYVSNDRMTNATLRERFGIEEKNYSIASRIIRETIKVKLIKPFAPENASNRHAGYVP